MNVPIQWVYIILALCYIREQYIKVKLSNHSDSGYKEAFYDIADKWDSDLKKGLSVQQRLDSLRKYIVNELTNNKYSDD